MTEYEKRVIMVLESILFMLGYIFSTIFHFGKYWLTVNASRNFISEEALERAITQQNVLGNGVKELMELTVKE